jgi:uncharacterized LabA/DUF88 family protein
LSKNVAMFVDVANLYYSARGQEVDVDYVALLKHATKGRDLIRAYAYSGLDPENENQRKFIDFLGKNGYRVITKDIRKFGDGRVKANLDIELVVDLFRLAPRMDIAVIVSGDGDFAPAIRALQDEGVRCEVISFRPNTSSDLIAVADEFIDIMKIGISRGEKEGKRDTGMSAPPMPAKEVVPEFGFREASPSVAAAALAALREGKEPKPAAARGRGRGRTRAEPVAGAAATGPVEPAEEHAAATLTAESGDGTEPTEGRRRRRRRGGRGRGRGRTRAEAEARVAETPDEAPIGWVELDDLSQVGELEDEVVELGDPGDLGDLGEERKYTFEEADAATLAELGLAPVDEPMEAAPVQEPLTEVTGVVEAEAVTTPARARTRRGRTRRASADVADAAPTEASAPAAEAALSDEGAVAEAPKPRRRRTRGATNAAGAGTVSETSQSVESVQATAPAPARPRRRRNAATGPTAATGSDEGEVAPAPPTPSARARRTSRSRVKASAASEASDVEVRPGRGSTAAGEETAGGSEEAEGIWQRFRSGRSGRRPPSS